MSRGLLCDLLDRDLACAVALNWVEMSGVVANAQTITFTDARQRQVGQVDDWLNGGDPLDTITRTFLTARLEAANAAPKANARPWEATARIKTREEANKRAIAARQQGKALLQERGVFDLARSKNLRVVE